MNDQIDKCKMKPSEISKERNRVGGKIKEVIFFPSVGGVGGCMGFFLFSLLTSFYWDGNFFLRLENAFYFVEFFTRRSKLKKLFQKVSFHKNLFRQFVLHERHTS